jgi:hypothetical protein
MWGGSPTFVTGPGSILSLSLWLCLGLYSVDFGIICLKGLDKIVKNFRIYVVQAEIRNGHLPTASQNRCYLL